jgi:myo-inositol-1(or 4)-monophosphatase
MADDLRQYLAIAVHAAKSAGKFLSKHIFTNKDILKQATKDIKFKFDEDAEEIIINELTNRTEFRILSEERGIVELSLDEQSYDWIVDPLDGSINYYQGIPLCCVSISLWKEQNPLLGVIYDFNRDDIYEGVIHKGARLNGNPISVMPFRNVDESILCTGFPSSMEFTSVAIEHFATQIIQFRKVRLLGSAALSLAYVAAGKVDAYYEKNIKIWDVAAGLALVKAAGGDIIVNGYPPSYIVEAFGGTSSALFINSAENKMSKRNPF